MAREVLQVAAVIGERFSDGLVASAVGRSALVCVPALDEAVAGGLVAPAGPAGVHRFVHALVRDAVEEGMSTVARARWHRVVAETIALLRLRRHLPPVRSGPALGGRRAIGA